MLWFVFFGRTRCLMTVPFFIKPFSSNSALPVCLIISFTASEAKRQSETEEPRHFYQGLPVTSVSVLLPLIYLALSRTPGLLSPAFYAAMALISLCFVANIRIPKLSGRVVYAMLVCTAAIACLLLGFGG